MTWYNDNWDYRRQITINATCISGNQINFPVLYRISGIGDKSLSNGTDIVFIDDDDSTRLHHDLISFYDFTGNSWIQMPYVSNNSDRSFYMYYGNLTGGDQTAIEGYRPSSTWDDTFSFVCHMNDINTSSLRDSTKWQTQLYKKIDDNPTMVSCFLGSAQQFGAVASLISSNSTNGFDTLIDQASISVIISGIGATANAAGYGYIASLHHKPTYTSNLFAAYVGTRQPDPYPHVVSMVISSQFVETTSAAYTNTRYWPSTNALHTSTIGWTYNSSNSGLYAYQSGITHIYMENTNNLTSYANFKGNFNDTIGGIYIGDRPALTRQFLGSTILDVQVLNVEKNGGWFLTKNTNVSSLSIDRNDIFYTIDLEEEAPLGGGSIIKGYMVFSGTEPMVIGGSGYMFIS